MTSVSLPVTVWPDQRAVCVAAIDFTWEAVATPKEVKLRVVARAGLGEGGAVAVHVADGDVVAVAVERAAADDARGLVGAGPDAQDLHRPAGQDKLVREAAQVLDGGGLEGSFVDDRVAGVGV